MARFEHSRGNNDRPKRREFNRGNRDNNRRNFNDRPQRDNRRGFNDRRSFNDRPRRNNNVEMTQVTCSTCGDKCEVPFKPTSSKPIYCDKCFSKKPKNGSNRDFDVINEKLNKIMKALNIPEESRKNTN